MTTVTQRGRLIVKTFWQRNQVFILGMLGAVAISLNQLLSGNPSANIKVFGLAALMAALSYIAKEWRGKGVTILGVLGSLAAAYLTLQQSGNFTMTQFVLFSITAILGAVAPPPKPDTYETNAAIVQAKELPAKAQTTDDSPSIPPPNIPS